LKPRQKILNQKTHFSPQEVNVNTAYFDPAYSVPKIPTLVAKTDGQVPGVEQIF
jgi:hypothetical protein